MSLQIPQVDSIRLMSKHGQSQCYGFVNFKAHDDAVVALQALEAGVIKFYDSRGEIWTLSGNWSRGNGQLKGDPEAKKKTGRGAPKPSPSEDCALAACPDVPSTQVRGRAADRSPPRRVGDRVGGFSKMHF